MVCQSDWLPMIMATFFASGAKPNSCAKEALDYRCGRLNGKALARRTRCIPSLRLLVLLSLLAEPQNVEPQMTGNSVLTGIAMRGHGKLMHAGVQGDLAKRHRLPNKFVHVKRQARAQAAQRKRGVPIISIARKAALDGVSPLRRDRKAQH